MAEGNVVGSAEFELRATRCKIQGDMEAARREVAEAAKRTEAELEGIVGTGTAKGSKKAAEALKEPKQAGIEAGAAIRDSMKKAGDEIAESIGRGARKAKADLESVAQKAREVQKVKLPTPTVPTEATHRLVTNPINGTQSWVPRMDPTVGLPPQSAPTTAVPVTPGLKEAAGDAGKLKDALDGVKPSAESTAEGLGKIDKSALLTGAAIGALIGGAIMVTKTMWDMGRAAMQAAGEIADTATRIGVSTDALQEWRYVAVKSGEDAKAADQALSSFAEKLALAGSQLNKQAVKDFGALGFSPEQLKSFKSTEEALDAVIDRISALKSESDRAAIADRLGLGPLVVAVRSGADEIASLRDEARQLGAVIDADVVKRGAEAQQQFETLSRVIDVQLKTAFIDLAPAIIKAIELVAKLAQDLNDALDQWRRLDERTGRGLQSERAKLVAERDAIAGQFGTRPLNGQVVVARRIEGGTYTVPSSTAVMAAGARPFGGGSVPKLPSASNEGWGLFERRGRTSYTDAGEQFDAAQRRIAAIDAELARRTVTNQAPQRQDRPGGTSLQLPPGRSSNTGQREAEREARRAERVEQEIFRARQRALGIFDREALTVQERFDIEQAQVKLEREAEQKQLESRLARKDITAKEYEQLKLLNDQTATLEDRVAADILARDLADERLAQERMLSDLTADLLSLQSGAARTAKERRGIELRLLAMAQQRARDERENDPKFRQLSPQRQQAIRDEQERVFGLQRDAVNRANLSPLDAWRDQSLKSIAEVREAYESVAARGLDALNAGIVDAIMNTRDLGEVFSNVAKQMMADIVSIGIRRNLTEPLAEMLFGGGGGGGAKAAARAAKGIGGGGGNWMSKLFSFGKGLFGFADGRVGGDGKIHGPGTPRSDSILALLDGEPIRVSRDESIMNAEATRKYAPALRAMNDGVFERYLGNLRGFKDGIVGLSMPSLAMPSIGGLGVPPGPRSSEPIVFDMRGAFVPETFMREVEQKVAAGEARAYGRAMNDAPKLTMSQTARQQRQAVGRQRRGS